jgi:hypothetical protein
MRIDSRMSPREAAAWWRRQARIEGEDRSIMMAKADVTGHTHDEGRTAPVPVQREYYNQAHVSLEIRRMAHK